MKPFTHTININNNSNYIIGHTESDWSVLRNGSLISIDDDNHFYHIGDVKKINLIVDFDVINDSLVLNGDLEENFIHNDVITISYKEYELLAIKSIVSAGSRYKVGDILYPSDGLASSDVVNNYTLNSKITVEEVDSNGGIKNLSISKSGNYIIIPSEINKISGGSGNDASLSLQFSLSKDRKMLERQIVGASSSNNQTALKLNYPLPNGVNNGKLSMNKFKAILTSTYIGANKRDCKYHISRDFTPHLGLPLLSKNSNKNEELFNHIILSLDERIRRLEEKISKISN